MASGLERSLAQIDQNMKDRREEIKREIVNEKRRSPNLYLQQFTKETNITMGSLNQQLSSIEKTLEERLKTLKQKVEKSVDLETRHCRDRTAPGCRQGNEHQAP